MEKIQLCVRHCAGPRSGRVDGGFQLCDLKNPRFLLVKKQNEIMHILFCSNYILLVSFLYATCGLHSLFENVYTRGKDGTLNDSHIMIRYMNVSSGRERSLQDRRGKYARKSAKWGANQIQAGFPLLYKGAIQSVKERPNFELLRCGEEWEGWRVLM